MPACRRLETSALPYAFVTGSAHIEFSCAPVALPDAPMSITIVTRFYDHLGQFKVDATWDVPDYTEGSMECQAAADAQFEQILYDHLPCSSFSTTVIWFYEPDTMFTLYLRAVGWHEITKSAVYGPALSYPLVTGPAP